MLLMTVLDHNKNKQVPLSLTDGLIDYHHSTGSTKDIAEKMSKHRHWYATELKQGEKGI